MITEHKGNIFTTNCNTIVNTVNCVGVMGTGIAYEFRLRYPEMFKQYKSLCDNGHFKIGSLWIFYTSENKSVLNFPTKHDWKYPSKVEYLKKGLQKFIDTYKEKQIKSIAFPLLGASHGGLTQEVSLSLMKKYLSKCQIPIEIWLYDKSANDDFYEQFKETLLLNPSKKFSKESGIRIDFINRLKKTLENENIKTMSSLLKIKGIGDVTLEKSFKYVRELNDRKEKTLFD